MGRLLYDGVLARDYPLIIGIILVVSIAVVWSISSPTSSTRSSIRGIRYD
jgi:ABC-type microcin C transport system permease subunit YejB